MTIKLFSVFKPLIPEVVMVPSSNEVSATLCLLHTRAGLFRGLKKRDEKSSAARIILSPSIKTEPVVNKSGPPDDKLSHKIGQMIRTASQLRRLQKQDDFRATSEESNRRMHYHMLGKTELGKLLKKEPANYKRCILRCQVLVLSLIKSITIL